MQDEIRLVIADDHPLMRDALRRTIEAEPGLQVVAEAGDGKSALKGILEHRPDIAVLDIDMPGLDGFAVARALREQGETIPIVVLTVHDDPAFFETALELGVKGYILKDSRASDIVAGVQAVAAGQVYASPALTTFLFDRGRRPPAEPTGVDKLTPTERRVLALVAAYKTSSAIAEDLGISVRTVQTHRSNICEKLGIEGSHALMKFALENAAKL